MYCVPLQIKAQFDAVMHLLVYSACLISGQIGLLEYHRINMDIKKNICSDLSGFQTMKSL